MTAKEDLRRKLNEQRQRRQPGTNPLVQSGIGKKRNYINLVIWLFLLLFGTAVVFKWMEQKPPAPPVSPTTQSFKAIDNPVTPTPRSYRMLVCTDIPNGRMNVHFDAGEGSEIRGYLKEGELVSVVQLQYVFGGTWALLNTPIVGWVNLRLLCPA